jgi:RecJ-like exonuclease
MQCWGCKGTGRVESSFYTGLQFARNRNNWETCEIDCPECRGTGLEHVSCFRCPERVPVERAVKGELIDAMFRSWWFCPDCARSIDASIPAIVPAGAAEEEIGDGASPLAPSSAAPFIGGGE